MNFSSPLSGGAAALAVAVALGLAAPGARAAADAQALPPADAQAAAPADTHIAPAPEVQNSVVKVFSTVRYPDPYRPWTKQAPNEVTGSGVVIEGRRILTNAHVVLYANQVQVQANQSGDKIAASVESIAPGIDLAVLKLSDETFFDSHRALPRESRLPEIKDSVLVYGFPTGGTSLSITKGIVSRIEFVSYNFPVSGLRIQIDAAINPGNSGGPAVAGDKMVGLAFSHLGGAENIGYIIPCEEIEFFLGQVAKGGRYGKPGLYDEMQTLENPALRAYLKLDKSVSGLIVTKPDSAEPAYPLRKWDVVTRIGSEPIDDEGMIHLNGDLRLAFEYMVQKIARNGKVPLTIYRQGKAIDVQLPVASDRPMLINDLAGEYPAYFILGPVVFTAVTRSYFDGINPRALSALSVEGSPLTSRRGDRPAFPGEQLVAVASPFLPHQIANNYGNPQAKVVEAVNGIPVRNLGQLVELFRDSKDEFVRIEFAGRATETLVFKRQELLSATDDILTDNGIRSQGSPDLMSVWNRPPAAH
ncbi:MAG: trypsin-like peptidase domain-containing protein [Opitutaceae bacterium]|jgi:S1-C subfamily serine protease